MKMHQPGEPSVEEILDSIKKVIARDNRAGAVATRRERTRAPASRVEPADAEEAEEVLELGEEAMVAHGGEESSHDCADTPLAEEDAPLTTDTVRASMQQNFEALAMISRPGKQPQIVRSGETSLEALTRELLRPMLAQWLDENLPEMVEELVKAEMWRIAGKRD